MRSLALARYECRSDREDQAVPGVFRESAEPAARTTHVT